MKLYADLPVRRTRQIVADVFMLGWGAVWIWAGVKIDHLVMNLAYPGEKLADAGRGFRDGLTSAGDNLASVPLVPDQVAGPFDTASRAGEALRGAGEAQISAVDQLATFLGVTIAVMPIVLLLVFWLPLRLQFIRQATAAQRFIDSAADLDLFALRALVRQPLTTLAQIHDDPAGAWRDRDPDVVRALALVELRASGLRPPSLGLTAEG